MDSSSISPSILAVGRFFQILPLKVFHVATRRNSSTPSSTSCLEPLPPPFLPRQSWDFMMKCSWNVEMFMNIGSIWKNKTRPKSPKSVPKSIGLLAFVAPGSWSAWRLAPVARPSFELFQDPARDHPSAAHAPSPRIGKVSEVFMLGKPSESTLNLHWILDCFTCCRSLLPVIQHDLHDFIIKALQLLS